MCFQQKTTIYVSRTSDIHLMAGHGRARSSSSRTSDAEQVAGGCFVCSVVKGGFVEDRVKVLASCWQVAASSSSSSRMV